MLSPQLVALFVKILEAFGGGAKLKEVITGDMPLKIMLVPSPFFTLGFLSVNR
jgi:hypothetical protein